MSATMKKQPALAIDEKGQWSRQDAEPIIPETLGACVDKLDSTRKARLVLQREVEALKKVESELQDHLINNVPKDSAGVFGRVMKALITKKDIPQVADWPAFYKYVMKKKAFELLQKRLSATAIQERWDAGEKIPGVEVFTTVGVSLTKI